MHGSDGFGDIFTDKPDISKLKKEHAVHALYKIVSDNPGIVIQGKRIVQSFQLFLSIQLVSGKISIACIGPLTNIALAIKLYPDFLGNVKEFFVMGGNHTGNKLIDGRSADE